MQMQTRTIAPDAFTRIMSLPQAARMDVLEFLGSTPLSQSQVDAIVDEAAARVAPRCAEAGRTD
jgi:hypothetical protein